MPGTSPLSLANHFLIAMPGLHDPNFSRTVTLICEHSDQGAMGIIVNRSSPLTLKDIFEQMEINAESSHHAGAVVHVGGPVHANRGFVLHRPSGAWGSSLAITDHLSVSTSRDILEALARNEGPEAYFIALGYAGWSAGQIEQEIADNAWLSGPADERILFDLPVEARWAAAAQLLGVDLNSLSGEAGHA